MNIKCIYYISRILVLVIIYLNETQSEQEVSFCLKNQYFNITSFDCVTCPEKCESCIDDQNCLSCKYGQNVNQECLDKQSCPMNQYFEKLLKKCFLCIPFCEKCSQQSICEDCKKGFFLDDNYISCTKINDSQIDEFSCYSGYQEKQGSCLKQKLCSSQNFSEKNHFNQNIIQILEDESNNIFIALNHKKIIVYDKENMNYINTVIEIPNSSSEIIIKGVFEKNILIFISNKNIYIYQSVQQNLKIGAFYEEEINGDTDDKQLYFDKKQNIITYLSITNSSLDIRIIQYNLVKDRSFDRYYLMKKQNSNILLLKKNLLIIFKFIYNLDLNIISIMTQSNVFIINLKDIKKLQIAQSPFDVYGSIEDLNQIFLYQSSDNNNEVICYATKQTGKAVIYIKIVFDIYQDYSSLKSNESDFFQLKSYFPIRDWDKFIQNNIYFEKYISQYVIIKDRLFIYAIAIIHTDTKQDFDNFFGFVDIEYFFNQSQSEYNKFELINKIEQFTNKIFITQVEEIKNQNNFLLILPYNNQIKFFELQFQQNNVEKLYNTVYLEQQEFDIIVYSSIKSKNQSTFYFNEGKVIGKLSLPYEGQQIQIQMTNIYDIKKKSNLYFSSTKVSQVIIPNDYKSKDSISKYSFIIQNGQALQKFSVTQMETLQNGNMKMVGHRFYYYQNIKFNQQQDNIIQSDTFQDDEQMILFVITNRQIYKIKYHSLDLLECIQIQNYLAKQMNVIVYAKFAKIITNEQDSNLKYQYDILSSKYNSQNSSDDEYTKKIATFFDLNKQQTVAFRINKINDQFQIFWMKQGPNYILNISINNQNIEYQDNTIQDIINFEFLSADQVGFFMMYFDQQNDILTYQFQRLSLEKQQDKYSYSIQQFTIDKKYECYIVEYSYFSVCAFYATEGYALTLFNWQTVSFVLDENGNLYEQVIYDYFVSNFFDGYFFEVLKFDQEKLDQSVYKVYMTLKFMKQTNYVLTEIGQIGILQLKLDTINQTIKPIRVQRAFSVPLNLKNQDIPNSDITLISKNDSGKVRLFSPKMFIFYGGYLDLETIYMYRSFAYFKQTNSLLYQKEGQVYSANRFGQFEQINYQYKSIFEVYMKQKGLLLVYWDVFRLLAADNLKVVHTFPKIDQYSRALWSEKFQALCLKGEGYLLIYYNNTNFTNPIYETISLKQNQFQTFIDCFMLQENHFIACNNVGLFDYHNKKWFYQFDLAFKVGDRGLARLADNKKYALFVLIPDLFIFSFIDSKFKKNQIKPQLGKGIFDYFLHNKFDNQLVLQSGDVCIIYLVPSMIEIFNSNKQKEYQSPVQQCIYADLAQLLLIVTQQKAYIYELPYDVSNQPKILSNFKLRTYNEILIQNSIIYQIFLSTKEDATDVVVLDSYDINTQQTKTQEFTLQYLFNFKMYLWEEKEILLITKYILIQGVITLGWDIKFGEETSFGISDYSIRYNYIYLQHELYNLEGTKYVISADVSGMFPFNQKTAQFRDTVQIQNKNEYFNFKLFSNTDDTVLDLTQDQDHEYITHFDQTSFKIIKKSLISSKKEILLDVYDIIQMQKYQKSYPAEYKTPFQVFKLHNLQAKTNDIIYGFFWKCSIIIFKKQQILQQFNLMDISNQCEMKNTGSQIFILNKDLKSFLKIFMNDLGQIEQNIFKLNPTQLVDNFYIDSSEKWILILTKNNQQNDLIQIYKNNNQIESASIPISSLLVTQVSFFQFKSLDFILIGLKDSTNYLLQLPEYSNKQPLASDQIKIIFQIQTESGKIMNFDQFIMQESGNLKLYNFYIYSSSQFRISLIQGRFNYENKIFDKPFSLKLQQYTHTRYEQQFKLQKNKYLTLFSRQQITIYSLQLEYVARIEEVYFIQIQDVILALDLCTFFVTESNGIYVYRTQNINERERLIIQDKFLFIDPQIYSIKYYEKDSPVLIVYGVDIKEVFTIKFSPNFDIDNPDKENQYPCMQQIDSLDEQSKQVSQYFNILEQNQFDQEKQIFLQLDVLKEQKQIVLPVKANHDIDDQENPFLLQRIILDINLKGEEVYLIQNNSTKNITNLLKSVKISNGTLLLENDIYLTNMDFIIFKDIKFKILGYDQIKIERANILTFDNCEFKQKQISSNEKKLSFFNIQIKITQVGNITINNFTIDSLNMTDQSKISFQECNFANIFNFKINNSYFSSKTPFISFSQQYDQINFKNISINTSILKQFLNFQDCDKIDILNLSFIKVSNSLSQNNIKRDRILQESDQIKFITAQYIKQSFTINQLFSKESSFYSLLYYTNWIQEERIIRNKIIIQKNKIDSKFKLSHSNVSDTQFIYDFLNIEENYIEIFNFNIINSNDCSIKIQNSKDLKISNLIFNQNNITNNNLLIQIQNSNVSIIDLNINNTKNNYKQNEYGLITILNSDCYINKLYGYNNTIKQFFIFIFGSFSNQKINEIHNCNIQYTEGGGIKLDNNFNINFTEGSGIKLNDSNKFKIKDSNISYNTDANKGGGISSKNTNLTLKKVSIKNNKANLFGGGIYLEESDLSLEECNIAGNKAQIGGGVRYINKVFRPAFTLNQLGQIKNNIAYIFGNNYGSFPMKIELKTNKDQTQENQNHNQINYFKNDTILAVSSSNQQNTTIDFQLKGEDGELLEPLDQIKVPIIQSQDQQEYYDFYIDYIYNTQENQFLILQNVSNNNNKFSFKKNFLHKGFNSIKLKNSTDQNTFSIKIISNFMIYAPQNNTTLKLEERKLELEINLIFRKCQIGEILKGLVNDFYECWECQDNTFSIVDPYSNNHENSCKECPDEAKCKGKSITPYEGFWREQNIVEVHECLNAKIFCTSQTGNKFGCANGYVGPLCESCDYENKVWGIDIGEEYKQYAKSGKYKCTICSDRISQKQQIVLSLVLGTAILSYLAYQIKSNYKKKILKMQAIFMKKGELVFISNSLNESEKSSISMKIMISYFQIIVIVFSYKKEVPDWLSAIQFFGNTIETTLYSLDCFFVTMKLYQYMQMVYLRLLWMLIIPFLYVVFLYPFYLIAVHKFKIKKNKNRKQNLMVSGLLKIYYMSYPGIIQQTIGIFSCKKINNVAYVLNDLQFKCYDNEYFYFNFGVSLPYMIATLVTPYLIMRKLIQNKEHLTLNPNIFISYGFYYSEYKQSRCYWEIIKIYKKIFIYIIVGIFNQSHLIQAILITFIILIYLRFQHKIQPFQYASFNRLDNLSQITAITTIICLTINGQSKQNEIIQILSLLIVIISNVYFFIRFISGFSSHLVQKPIFKKMIILINKYLPKCIPEIKVKEINILRLTKNWKKLKFILESRYFKYHSIYNIQTFNTMIFSSPTKKDLFQKPFKKSPILKANLQMSMNQRTEECSSIPSENMFSPPITLRLNTKPQSPNIQMKNKQLSDQICSESKILSVTNELQSPSHN